MGRSSKHWKCFAADKANNPSMVQGTNSGVDLLEACQDNNIPTPNRQQRDFSLCMSLKYGRKLLTVKIRG